jgi:PAS domain-containing protein
MLSRRRTGINGSNMSVQQTPFRSRARMAAESAALHGSIADHLGDIVSIHDLAGAYRYVSAAIRDVLGYDPQEVSATG